MVKNNNNKKNYEKERLKFYVRDSCNSSDENGTL